MLIFESEVKKGAAMAARQGLGTWVPARLMTRIKPAAKSDGAAWTLKSIFSAALITVFTGGFLNVAAASDKINGSPLVVHSEDEKAGVAFRSSKNRGHPHYHEVTASIAQLGEPLAAISGGCIKVHTLLGSGADPHLYRLTRADVLKIHKSRIVHYVGHLLEAQMQHLFDQIDHRKSVLPVGEMLDRDLLVEVGREIYDPHIWMDPLLWSRVLTMAATNIASEYPECRDTIMAGMLDYLHELDHLHRATAEFFSSIPPERRVLVTSHDAFGYFGKRYGVQLVAIQGISTDRQISVRRISKLVDFLIEEDIRSVFVESSVSPRDMIAVVEGAGRRGHEVKIGGSLFSDAMGREDTPEGTYLGMFKYNVRTIAKAWGYDDKLPPFLQRDAEQGA